MATIFVDDGGDNSTGASWATAKTTLAAGLTASAAGDVIYIGHNHVESTASAVALTAPGTATSPNHIICVTQGSTPVSADIMTTPSAQVSTTGASNITTTGIVGLCSGIIFSTGSGASVASWLCSGDTWRFKDCAIRLGNTSASSFLRPSASGERTIWENCTCQFGAVGQSIGIVTGGEWHWKGGSITGATIPTTFFGSNASIGTHLLEGVDLTALSGKNLLSVATGARATLTLKDCKLPASITLKTGTAVPNGSELILIRTDSGDTNYRTEKHVYEGNQTIEIGIVRTGGATDGTTPISWKIDATNAKWALPYTSLPIQIWNETTGSRTITVYGVWGGGAVPNNDEIWIEVEYLGTSGFPIGSFTNTTKADFLASATATNSDTSTWASAPGTDFTMTKTVTINEKGPITIWIKAVGAGPFYIDPKVVLT